MPLGFTAPYEQHANGRTDYISRHTHTRDYLPPSLKPWGGRRRRCVESGVEPAIIGVRAVGRPPFPHYRKEDDSVGRSGLRTYRKTRLCMHPPSIL